MALSWRKKNYLHYYEKYRQNMMVIFTVEVIFICLEQKTSTNHIKKYAEIKIFGMF